MLAWRIESGEYDGENLAGPRLAAVLAGDFTVSTATAPRRSTVFVDARAREAQRRAGLAWLRSEYRDILGHVLGVHEAHPPAGWESVTSPGGHVTAARPAGCSRWQQMAVSGDSELVPGECLEVR